MKFKIICANYLVIKEKEDLPFFQNLGFVFEEKKADINDYHESKTERLDSSNIFIEINNLEDLEILSAKSLSSLIIDFKDKEIIIYNGYIE